MLPWRCCYIDVVLMSLYFVGACVLLYMCCCRHVVVYVFCRCVVVMPLLHMCCWIGGVVDMMFYAWVFEVYCTYMLWLVYGVVNMSLYRYCCAYVVVSMWLYTWCCKYVDKYKLLCVCCCIYVWL